MEALDRLHDVLEGTPTWYIAVSGGVDSMTLATLAHRHLPERVCMMHATSPAVPASARAVIEAQAVAENWKLRVIDAGEMADERYRANPIDRCYYCKSHLYSGMLRDLAEVAGVVVASGTNTDDLGDFRPGLLAAAEHRVRHPYVEAGIDKALVRALARAHELNFAELPAQPCLASRIETGIGIEAADLTFIDRLETALRERLGIAVTLRVRLRHAGVVIEYGNDITLDSADRALAQVLCEKAGRRLVGIEPYRMGSAFVEQGT